MKYSLLQYVQNILSSMGSDEINSIGDTTESQQVANIIEQTYYNMIGRYDLPEHNQLIQLTPSNNAAQPVLMTRPAGTSRIEWIKYFDTNPSDGNTFTDQYGAYSQHDVNTDLQNNSSGWVVNSTTSNTIGTGSITFTVPANQTAIVAGSTAYVTATSANQNNMSGTVTSYTGTTLVLNITSYEGSGTFTSWLISQSSSSLYGPGYKEVEMLSIDAFLNMVTKFNLSESDVESMTVTIQNNSTGNKDNYTFYYKNDKQPEYCTVFQNYYLIFDSYDNTQDTTLQASKTMALAWVVPTFLQEDNFIPELDEQQVPLFLAESKSLAFYELKQQSHEKAEQEVSRQLPSLQKWKAISGKPSYYNELPGFGRRGGGWYGGINRSTGSTRGGFGGGYG